MSITDTKPVVVVSETLAPQPQRPSPVVATVQRLIDTLEQKGFNFPDDYSVGNALASAKLALQEVRTRDNKKIVDDSGRSTGVVTEASMVNAVFDMCVQGLNIGKKQGYFIVYDNQLVFQRSYFGEEALAKRILPGIEFYSDVIRKGDDFATEKIRSRFVGWIDVVSKHVKPFPRTSQEIIGAYCGIVDAKTGEDLGMVLMDMDRIKKSWSQSKTYKADGNGPHNKFPDEMSLRTVIRRRAKPIINSSSDAHLMESIRRQDEDAIDAEISEEASTLGNRQPLALSESNAIAAVPAATPEPEEAPVEKPVAASPATQAALAPPSEEEDDF